MIWTTPHSHDGNSETVEATKIRSILKETATTSRRTPAQILADQTAQVPFEIRAVMGVRESIKRTIRREKAKLYPKNPAKLPELVIPDEWTATGDPDNETFLIYDRGSETAERMVVFASEMGLTQLSRADTWHMDGTFDSSPAIFEQLYAIRVPFGEGALSCVYAFLSGKSQSTYEERLHAILNGYTDLGFQPNPTTVVTDFEQAIITALTTTTGLHVQTQGCFYHLAQSTWRKVQKLEIVTSYRSSEEVKLFCGMLDRLAFLPFSDVPAGMDYLKEHTPEGLEPLIDYFDSTYVSGTFHCICQPPGPEGVVPSMRMRRIPPLFPPELWNVHEVTICGGSRTINMCETWNNVFRSIVGCSHPTIWLAICNLRKDHNDVATTVLWDSCGQPPKKRVR